MNHYRVRVQNPSAMGFLTQADHYKDFDFEDSAPLEAVAERLAAKGFMDERSGRWFMPGGIIWIERK